MKMLLKCGITRGFYNVGTEYVITEEFLHPYNLPTMLPAETGVFLRYV